MNEPDEAGRLYLTLGRVNRALRREASHAPVGHGALSALSTLSRHGPQRLGSLAAVEGISPPSMTRIITSLEQLGLVRRVADPLDGRATIVEATASGQQVVLAGRAARMNAQRGRVEKLSAQQRRALYAALPALEALAAGDAGTDGQPDGQPDGRDQQPDRQR
jgi:DNA-binding MarR family transcriptional regulator